MTHQTASAARPPIRFERRYDAPIEDLWELWTTKDGFASWWGPQGYRVEVHTLDPRVGGELYFDLIAVAADQIAYLEGAGRPLSHESRGTFVEVAPLERLKIHFTIDFIQGVAPYDFNVLVEFFPDGAGVRMVTAIDRHHDEEWTRLAAVGFESALTKLSEAIAERSTWLSGASRFSVGPDAPTVAGGDRWRARTVRGMYRMDDVFVMLLRGINVGGKNKLPMKDFAALLAESGCGAVQTYIQSGNAVFQATETIAGSLPTAVAEAIAARFGLRVPVVMRTAGEMRAVVEGNPFLRAGAAADKLHVAFLADRPEAARVAALDPEHSPPDAFAVRGREIYLRCPNGLARTKLTNDYLDSRLATTSTVRNWRTVLKLTELAEGG
jgi:uncharacterized protein (DUF1697 family)/uncharacterized protein YndB with AHSA1/START domain